MVQQYPYYTRWVKTIVGVLHIYEALAIFLLFCNHQDTESESQEMEIGLAGPIFTPKIIKGTTISIPHKMGEHIMAIFFHGDKSIFLLFCNHQDTKSESCEIEIGATGPMFTYEFQSISGEKYLYSTRWEQNIGAIIHIY